ncbi:MAG: AlpA family transcriptional regulator [Candidatus Riflebacteria bacterium]|nr:AlpA family transcriptional regulator [Candidatus Riflebacteria bacterium]
MNRFLRLSQIIPDLIPIGKSSWWAGIRKGLYPKGVKLGPRTTVWRAEDIQILLEKLKKGGKD